MRRATHLNHYRLKAVGLSRLKVAKGATEVAGVIPSEARNLTPRAPLTRCV